MKRAFLITIGVVAMGWALWPSAARAYTCVVPPTVADAAFLRDIDAAFLGTVVDHRDDVEYFAEPGSENDYDGEHYDTIIFEVHHDVHGNLGNAVEVVVDEFSSFDPVEGSSFPEGETLGVGLVLVNHHWVAYNGCPAPADPASFMEAAATVRPAAKPVVGPPPPSLAEGAGVPTRTIMGVTITLALVAASFAVGRRARAP